jgi:hypothetical protein
MLKIQINALTAHKHFQLSPRHFWKLLMTADHQLVLLALIGRHYFVYWNVGPDWFGLVEASRSRVHLCVHWKHEEGRGSAAANCPLS